MKTTFNLIFAFLFGLFSTSCQNQPSKSNTVRFYQNSNELYSQVNTTNTENKSKQIEFKTVNDPEKNTPVYFIPIPSDWTIKKSFNHNENILIEGPNNVKVYGDKFNIFSYSNDPYFNQTMQQKGNQISPIKTPEQVIKETIAPLIKTIGLELIKTYKLPKLVTYDKNFDQYIFKYIPEPNKIFDVVASEWTDNKGTSALIILRYGANVDHYQLSTWYYYVQGMECDTKHFEQAKQEYLYALENTKYNPDWIKSNYLRDVEASKRAGEIHAINMRQLREHADAAYQKGIEHSRTVDRNHAKFMDVQLDRTNVSTTSGQSYKVDAGSSYYWMNSNGQYISSNDPNYNPNTHPSYNNINWKSTTINN